MRFISRAIECISILKALLALSYSSCGQSVNLNLPDSIQEICNTAGQLNLKQEEKNAILYCNVARCFPQFFSDSILKPYLVTIDNPKNDYHNSLVSHLDTAIALNPLIHSSELSSMADEFATYCGRSGKQGHINITKRSNRVLMYFMSFGENLAYGYDTGLSNIMALLIDEGVKDLGHRKNILNPDFRFVGNAITPHKTYTWNYVQLFAGERAK